MNSEIFNTIIAALSGGVMVKLFDMVFISRKDKGDALIMLVKQLQENVNACNEEIKELKVEATSWRDKYYTELQEKNKLADELRLVRLSINKFNSQNH